MLLCKNGFFNNFGTYCLDSATTWAEAAMNKQLKKAGIAGKAPRFTKDYTPQKVDMVNSIKKMMNIPCDFFLLGHLEQTKESLGFDAQGNERTRILYRFLTTGKASVTIPLQFDELYVAIGREKGRDFEYKLLIKAQGQYIARSRLQADGVLAKEEPPDIKALLKKIGLDWQDKPKLG